MKRLLLIFILTFSFQTLTKADDIGDFEIEGFSLGDSLLNYFNKKDIDQEINSEFSYKYKGGNFVKVGIGKTSEFPLMKDLVNYDELGITINLKKNYKIYGLSGDIICDDLKKCFSKKKEIIKDFKNTFKIYKIDEWENPHPMDKSGKSIVYGSDMYLEEENITIAVKFYDMNVSGYGDTVAVEIKLKEYADFLVNEAYK